MKFLQFLLSLLLEHKKSQITQKVEPTKEKPKVAIIVGHDSREQGASVYTGSTEYIWNSNVAGIMLQKASELDLKVFTRNGIGRQGVADQVGDFAPKLSIELHLNSFHTKALGCEVLYHADNSQDKQLAQDLAKMISDTFKTRLRADNGAKAIAMDDRGHINLFLVLEKGIDHVLLVEPCFANIETSESKAVIENPDKYAEVLLKFIKKVLT
jgi:N-acetylmuramoyl-L-alanine amidase